MRIFNITFFSLFLLISTTYAQLSENFDDGNFNLNPTWEGDVGKFVVNNVKQLQLNAISEAGKAYIVTSSMVNNNATWETYIKLTFTPSSSNYLRWYLISDKAELTGPLNGYYILVGNTSKNICLYRQNGSTSTKIIDTPINRLIGSSNELRIKITRNNQGEWEIYSKLDTETSWIKNEATIDNTHQVALFTGFVCYYTATRSNGFYFDDIVINGDVYSPPVYEPYEASFGDIVFNEIMANPNPPFGLPNEEYIELYNNTNQYINLQDYVLSGFNKICNFPYYIMQPNSYVVLCHPNAYASLEMYGNCLAIDKFPTLTNSGGFLELFSSTNKRIAWLEYSDTWHTDALKKNGGWSLECRDPNNLIGNNTNWTSSIHFQGGTPNAANSILTNNLDNEQLRVTNITIINDKSVVLLLNKPIFELSELNNPNLLIIPNLTVAKFYIDSKNQQSIRIDFSNQLQRFQHYEINFNNLLDINQFNHNVSTKIAIPETPLYNDIVINEILFNPKSPGVDYVELYNRSNKVIDLQNIILTNKKEDGTYQVFPTISNPGFLLFPKEFAVISTNSKKICEQYLCDNTTNFIQVKSMPSMPDNKGNIYLITPSHTIVDAFHYTEKMHHPIISNREGISLERIHYDIPSSNYQNWHSAASTQQYGTPGYQNSQFKNETNYQATFTITPKSFSPNNDGFDDVLNIHYQFEDVGNILNITILSASGMVVKNLYQNILVATDGVAIWNGTDNNDILLPIGIYIVYKEAYSPNGKVIKEKNAVVLTTKNI